MKTQILTLLLLIVFFSTVSAQNEVTPKNDFVMYSFIINKVPDRCNIPMVGFINIANGTHHSVDVGFVNTIGKDCNGGQVGFINTVGRNMNGGQIGFINTTAGTMVGSQIGFINTSIKKSTNVQVGFINTCPDSLDGVQIGFVNTALRKANATQVGFINTAKNISGLQIGFLNLADSIESGFPVGFLSIVKHGGYQAVELSVSEMYPLNISYKIGLSKFYTSFVLSYDPANVKNIAFGAGFGSLLPIGKKFSFNPECLTQTSYIHDFEQQSSFVANVGYNLNQHLSLFAGPSVVWQYGDHKDDFSKPLFAFATRKILDNGRLISGARFSIRYKF